MGEFVEKELEEWRWVATIASATLAPTAAEVNGGTKITDAIADVTGFTAEAQTSNVTSMKGGFEPVISGAVRGQPSALTFNEQDTYAGNTILIALVEGATGYVVISRWKKGTLAAADKVDVFPVRIPTGGKNKTRKTSDDPAQTVVAFNLTATPAKDIAVLA